MTTSAEEIPYVLRRSAGAREAIKVWKRAYDSSPKLLSTFPWTQIVEVLETYPGERVYEVGFGSGANLVWARENGWEVAGCDVSPQAFASARTLLPGADLRLESILDCTAPSDYYDVVVDRAALCYAGVEGFDQAFDHIHRILKTGGVMSFNPYGEGHTYPMPADVPDPPLLTMTDACALFAPDKWEVLTTDEQKLRVVAEGEQPIEHTLRITARKR